MSNKKTNCSTKAKKIKFVPYGELSKKSYKKDDSVEGHVSFTDVTCSDKLRITFLTMKSSPAFTA